MEDFKKEQAPETKEVKKLVLNKETVRVLSDEELKQAAGGKPYVTKWWSGCGGTCWI
ncbi:hypothetical protein PAESOLCIP111_04286 [Paenibacillus solanacearum]|uniref:Uncharacterized protein n=1 Tax=Paenibacillus solanacearum TaxID=2048548 RepID=A0A916NQU5_9BACL|nr:class I lanthipeptide [Paenibacillus solanacearum]CAG7641944.1 hypothetical protein PAESOLCIP111_04286 [Paenibacillus solanacearum]